MKKMVFITGATGFIGTHLVNANLKIGNQVIAFVLPNDLNIGFLKENNVEIRYGNIRNYEEVENALTNEIDIVFHCAAFVSDWGNADLFKAVMINGTENVCKAASKAKVERFVKISTNDVFGLDESIIINETTPLSKWNEPYSDTKLAAEEVAWHYYKTENLPVTMVYPCWVYGPGDKTFVPLLADAILKKEMVFMRKNAIVWPTYIDNLVDLLMLISTEEKAIGEGFLVHDGEFTTLENFTNGVAKAIGGKEVKQYIPYWIAYLAAYLMEIIWKLLKKKERPLLTTYTVKNLGSRLKFSIEKAKDLLNWTPKITHSEGFEKTMEWLINQNFGQLKQK